MKTDGCLIQVNLLVQWTFWNVFEHKSKTGIPKCSSSNTGGYFIEVTTNTGLTVYFLITGISDGDWIPQC